MPGSVCYRVAERAALKFGIILFLVVPDIATMTGIGSGGCFIIIAPLNACITTNVSDGSTDYLCRIDLSQKGFRFDISFHCSKNLKR